MRQPPLFVFHLTAWLGSFLLFHLELLIAKLLLPSFGGSAYVWTTCVMMYQGLLLVGYAAYRWLAQRFGVVRYAPWHAGLLLAGLLWLPLRLPDAPAGLLVHHPIAALLLMLAVGIGAPFVLLSMTSVVMQGWFAHAPGARGQPAHILYAASNAGALAALLLFPLVLEPYCPLDAQRRLWGWGYGLLVLLHLWCRPRGGATTAAAHDRPSATMQTAGGPLVWCLLSAASCAFMLAMTNVLTIELGAVSLCWVLPMAVYLLTWILNFKERPWYPRWLPAAGCAAVVAVALAQTFRPEFTLASFRHTAAYVLIFHAILFWVCMLCHHHLVLHRPASAAGLPAFYLWIAVGGWLGSVLIGVVMPLAARHTSTTATDWIVAMLFVLAALVATEQALVASAVRRHPVRLGLTAAVVLILGVIGVRRVSVADPALRYAVRNFYGISRVVDRDGLRKLEHGTTIHGQQFLHPARQEVPLAYYHPHGPLGQVFAQQRSPQRLAAVGLGAGCVAAYLQAGQRLDVYELDPDVVDIAQRYFTYLRRTAAETHIVVGDARRSLTLAEGAIYDVMLLDAFGGDAIPTHLLTVEAFRLYLDRLRPNGQIALHLSSRHYRLMPVIAAAARAVGWQGVMRTTHADAVVDGEELPSQWVVLARTAESLRELQAAGWADVQQADPRQQGRPWTDQRANLLAALAPLVR